MSGTDHERFRDDAGAYLLGALDDDERQAFERHMECCPTAATRWSGCGRRPRRCPARWSRWPRRSGSGVR